MLSFQEQQKVLKTILQRETNKHCADCGSHTPTWASLDFGVFVCSNCSGAHRALGPTITRIKSTKLDQWNKDWVENMRIGNLEVNQFWQADGKTATVKKPRSGATLDDHNRYVYDKYMRKKFVVDKTATDPLTAYKSGKHAYSTNDLNLVNKQRSKNIYSSLDGQMPAILGYPKKYSDTSAAKKQPFDLLDQGNQVILNHQNKHKNGNILHQNPNINQNGNKIVDDDDQFTQYIDANVNVYAQAHQNHAQHNNTQQQQQDPSKLSFDDLLKQPQLSTPQSQPPQTIPNYPQQNYPWNGYNNNMNMNIQHHQHHGHLNYGQNFYQQQQQYVNQFAHNPYIGYAPHNSLHAAYNMNMNFYN